MSTTTTEALLTQEYALHAIGFQTPTLAICSCGKWSHTAKRSNGRDSHDAFRTHLARIGAATLSATPDDETPGLSEADQVRMLYSHIHRGGCPDEPEGWESRDWECTSCAVLDHFLRQTAVARALVSKPDGLAGRMLILADEFDHHGRRGSAHFGADVGDTIRLWVERDPRPAAPDDAEADRG